MPRQVRIESPGALHHIVIRGIERKAIFEDDQDREDFLKRLSRLLQEMGYAVLRMGHNDQPRASAAENNNGPHIYSDAEAADRICPAF